MQLFSGRKVLAASTFLGIGAGEAPRARIVPTLAGAPAADPTQTTAGPAPAPAPGSAPRSAKPAKGKKSTKTKKADGGEPDGDDDDDEDDNDDEDGDEDSDEEEMRRGSGSTICRARRRERARIGAILAHPSAAKNPDFAAHVALNMDIGREAACALLDKAPAPAAPGPAATGLASRMEPFKGVAAPPNGPPGTAEQAQKAILDDAFSRIAITSSKKS